MWHRSQSKLLDDPSSAEPFGSHKVNGPLAISPVFLPRLIIPFLTLVLEPLHKCLQFLQVKYLAQEVEGLSIFNCISLSQPDVHTLRLGINVVHASHLSCSFLNVTL